MGLTLVEKIEANLPPWIIEKIKEEERRKQEQKRPEIQLPVYDPMNIPPLWKKPEEKKDEGGKVIEIQIYQSYNFYI